jgi:hypothetical protein
VRFNTPVAIDVGDMSRPSHAQLAVDGDRVAVAWDDGFGQIPSVEFRLSNDGGNTFARATVASAKDLVASFPVVAFANGELSLAWTEEDPAARARADSAAPDMKDPGAVKGLTPVGSARVMTRRSGQ